MIQMRCWAGPGEGCATLRLSEFRACQASRELANPPAFPRFWGSRSLSAASSRVRGAGAGGHTARLFEGCVAINRKSDTLFSMSQAKGNLVFSIYPDRDQENFISGPVTREAFVEKNLKLSNLIWLLKVHSRFSCPVINDITNQVILYWWYNETIS
jgi:hypothetical protein